MEKICGDHNGSQTEYESMCTVFKKTKQNREDLRCTIGEPYMTEGNYFALFGTSEASAGTLYHLGTALKIHTGKMKENRGQ